MGPVDTDLSTDAKAAYQSLRDATAQKYTARTIAMALTVYLAEIVGECFLGDSEEVLTRLRQLIAEYRAKHRGAS